MFVSSTVPSVPIYMYTQKEGKTFILDACNSLNPHSDSAQTIDTVSYTVYIAKAGACAGEQQLPDMRETWYVGQKIHS